VIIKEIIRKVTNRGT